MSTTPELKAEIDNLLGRDVGVEQTRDGKWICKYADYNNPHPAQLVGDTEEIAYAHLLSYLKSKPAEG